MSDLRWTILNLRRPRLLARAAQEGARAYRRNRDLKRILGAAGSTDPSEPMEPRTGDDLALERLLELEAEQEQARRSEAPGYSLVRHVELLIAIAAEGERLLARIAQLPNEIPIEALPAAQPNGQENGPQRFPSTARKDANSGAQPSADRARTQRKLSGTAAFFSAT